MSYPSYPTGPGPAYATIRSRPPLMLGVAAVVVTVAELITLAVTVRRGDHRAPVHQRIRREGLAAELARAAGAGPEHPIR